VAVEDPLVGKVFVGRYRIDALVGRGGMGAVYKAFQLSTKREVAVKVLSAEGAALPEAAKRFQREGSVARKIDHPNVVAISDSGGLDDGSLYLVMELLAGRSLEDVLKTGPMPLSRALGIMRQILAGLGAAHTVGIVHRDVKPANVMLLDGDRVKLFDFGIAWDDAATEKLTAAGVACGTPEYISPEMAMGLAVDARADLYAAGVILFEMVAGRLPFVAPEPTGFLKAHLYEKPPTLSEVAGRPIPPALEAVVARAMAKESTDRFPSAGEMSAALAAIEGPAPKPVAAKKSSSGMGIAIAVVLLLLVGGGAAVWWFLLRAPEAGSPEPTVTPAASKTKSPPKKPRAH
jgi:serine/threonine-protein kinase